MLTPSTSPLLRPGHAFHLLNPSRTPYLIPFLDLSLSLKSHILATRPLLTVGSVKPRGDKPYRRIQVTNAISLPIYNNHFWQSCPWSLIRKLLQIPSGPQPGPQAVPYCRGSYLSLLPHLLQPHRHPPRSRYGWPHPWCLPAPRFCRLRPAMSPATTRPFASSNAILPRAHSVATSPSWMPRVLHRCPSLSIALVYLPG